MPPTIPSPPLPLRVLLTGYGPFARTKFNPSWLAVRELNGTYLNDETTSHPPIHLTSFEIPVTYTAVLAVVPNLHARPPTLPNYDTVLDPGLPPPAEGYDFILHVGLGSRGGLSIEKRGRKEGYSFKDVDGELAPIIASSAPEPTDTAVVASEAILREKESLGGSQGSSPDEPGKHIRRGFGDNYKDFPEELWSTLDVEGIKEYLKGHDSEKVVVSDDAGLYLCEFINFCCMAESRRSLQKATGKPAKQTKVLFVHCPPDGEDLSIRQTSEGLVKIVKYICWGLGNDDIAT